MSDTGQGKILVNFTESDLLNVRHSDPVGTFPGILIYPEVDDLEDENSDYRFIIEAVDLDKDELVHILEMISGYIKSAPDPTYISESTEE